MSKTIKNPTKVITGKNTIMSYLNVNEPKVPLGGGTPKYSVSLIIPKSDTVTVAKIRAAIQAAYEEGQSKLKGNSKFVPALEDIKTPLRDGDKDAKETRPTRTHGSSMPTAPQNPAWWMRTASPSWTALSCTPGSSAGRPSTSTPSTATAIAALPAA